MPFFPKFHLLRGGSAAPRRRRKSAPTVAATGYLERSRTVAILIFLATVAAIVLISFVGVSSATLPVLPNQLAMVRIVASAPFTYESKLKTELSRHQRLNRVPPVYRLELGPLQQFDTNLHELLAALDKLEQDYPATAVAASGLQGAFSLAARRTAELNRIVEAFNAKGPYQVSVEDVAMLLALGDAKARDAIAENGLAALQEIYREGVYSGGNLAPGATDSISIFRIRRPTGEVAQMRVQSLEEALTFLRINLAAEGVSREATLALFRLFRNGVTPDLVYDREATERLQQQALTDLTPVVVSVERGQTIIEPGTRVTPEQYEMLVAHRDFLLHNGDVAVDDNLQLFGRILLVLAMVMASVLYIRLEDPEDHAQQRPARAPRPRRDPEPRAGARDVLARPAAVLPREHRRGVAAALCRADRARAAGRGHPDRRRLGDLHGAVHLDFHQRHLRQPARPARPHLPGLHGRHLRLPRHPQAQPGRARGRDRRLHRRLLRPAHRDRRPAARPHRAPPDGRGPRHGPAHRRGRRRPAARARGAVQAHHRHHAAGVDGLQSPVAAPHADGGARHLPPQPDRRQPRRECRQRHRRQPAALPRLLAVP